MDDTVRRSHEIVCLKSEFKQERRELRRGEVRNDTKDQKKQQEKHRQWLRWRVLFPQLQHIDKAVKRLSLGSTHSHTTFFKRNLGWPTLCYAVLVTGCAFFLPTPFLSVVGCLCCDAGWLVYIKDRSWFPPVCNTLCWPGCDCPTLIVTVVRQTHIRVCLIKTPVMNHVKFFNLEDFRKGYPDAQYSLKLLDILDASVRQSQQRKLIYLCQI